jgi:K+-transporting ATPase ATPase A chain
MGPVASQEAIKMLGTNGGGFFNANSAHPFENPTPFANFVELLSMLIIPAALCLVFGQMITDRRQGVALLAFMTICFAACVAFEIGSEQSGNPAFTALHVDQNATTLQSGGIVRRSRQRARLADAARRPHAAAVDAVGRSDLRWCRFGSVWPARVRIARRVRRGADDRPHA